MPPPPAHGYSVAELELADRARAGDQRAMARLYERYAPRLYVHAVRMLGNEAAAHDAVQEAFVRALSAISRTREELRFRAWIYRIVTNLCLRQLNQRQRWSGKDVPERDERADGPEQDLRRAQAGVQVMAALEELPPAYRQILVLRELDELSYEDLARVLESDVSRVRVCLHRARARLAAVFIADRLLEDPGAAVECAELSALLEQSAGRKELIKHLEQCPRCRKRRHRPAAELLALLPAVDLSGWQGGLAPPWGAAPPPGVSALHMALKALAPVLVGGAALVVGTLAITGDGRDPGDGVTRPAHLVKPLQHTEARGSGRAPKVAVQASGSGLRAPGSRVTPAAPVSPARAVPLKKNGRAPQRSGRATPKTTGEQRPLAIKLQFTPGTLKVRRGAQLLVPAGPKDLALGDVLEGNAGASFGVWVPRRQWIIAQGRLRLDSVPYKKAKPSRVRVTLLAGQVRVRATSLGRGVAVGAGGSLIQADRGLFRVRKEGAKVRVESVDAYVSVSGPHAARTVSPATGLSLGRRPGYSHRLPPAPRGLRPVQACGRRPPRLSWKRVPGTGGYRVQVATDTDFRDLRADLTVTGLQASPGELEPGKYYWRVLARDDARQGLPSKIYGFTVSDGCP